MNRLDRQPDLKLRKENYVKNPNCLFTSALAYYQEEMLKLLLKMLKKNILTLRSTEQRSEREKGGENGRRVARDTTIDGEGEEKLFRL